MGTSSIVRSAVAPLTLLCLLVGSPLAFADVITVGNDAVDRNESDGWSNFLLNLTTEEISADGIVTDWEVYASNDGSLALLILDGSVVTASHAVEVTAGFNAFSFSATSGSAMVQAGDTLGLWIGSARVDFDRTGDDWVNWCGSAGCATSAPTAGETINFTGGGDSGNGIRQYSVNATIAVPEPSTLALLGAGLVGLGFARRQKKA